jgi:hypothetical protein
MLLAVVAFVAACGGSGETTTTTVAGETTTTAGTGETTTTAGTGSPAVSPSDIVAEDQSSDGTTITVASVTLPSPGFIAVHGNSDGAPGPVIGNSELLPAGTSTDVVVTLDQPLTATDMVFPMVHIDMNSNGVYEFFPPDETIDSPGTFADGAVAVVGLELTVA